MKRTIHLLMMKSPMEVMMNRRNLRQQLERDLELRGILQGIIPGVITAHCKIFFVIQKTIYVRM